MATSNLQPGVSKFIENHQDELTLESIRKIVNIKSASSGRDDLNFIEYVNQLEQKQSTSKKEFKAIQEGLSISKVRLEQLRQERRDKFNSIDDPQLLNNIIENSAEGEKFDKFKERDKLLDDIILEMEKKLENHEQEVFILQSRCLKAEEKRDSFRKLSHDEQTRKVQLEADWTANNFNGNSFLDKSEVFERSINRSFDSSYNLDLPPPPPPHLDFIPTVEQILNSK